MNLLLIAAYTLLNVYMVYYYYHKPMGIFSPVFILAMMSLGQLLPQLTTIYFLDDVYPRNIIPSLGYIMFTCNLAFFIGWEQKMKFDMEKMTFFEFKEKWLLTLIVVFSICGFIFTTIIKLKSTILDGVIAFQFQGIGFLGMILSILFLSKYGKNHIVIICLAISTLSILEYALTIYGSRQSIFTVALLYAYLWVKKKPHQYTIIKRCFLIFFILGMIGSLSIVEVRKSIHSEQQYLQDIHKVNFMENVKNAFVNSYHKGAGMDLGNAALAINHCQETGQYNYGLFLWNGFVFNYVPRRLVGEDFKQSLMINEPMNKYIKQITHDITCTTGYYDAFSSFAYLGFIVFYLFGRLFRFFRNIGFFTMFYEMIFLFALVNSSVGTTHGLQLVFAKFEFVVFLFIILFFTLKRIRFARMKISSKTPISA